jgi:DnaK suppressor protein
LQSPQQNRSELALEAALARLDLDTAIAALMTGALERIANGTYGRCTRCSGNIAAVRLRALPWVGRCVDCQDATPNKTPGGSERCRDFGE